MSCTLRGKGNLNLKL